jgi:hypothetical protein
MPIPIPLILAGVAAGAQLGGAIHNAATAKDRKRDWKREQNQQAIEDLLLQRSAMLRGGRGPNIELAGALRDDQINRAADKNFKVDPMSFVPFVQSGAQFAGQLYDYANSAPQGQRAPVNSVLEAQAAAQKAAEQAERAQAAQYFKQNGWKGYGSSY